MRTTRLLVLPIVLAAFAGSVACSSDDGGADDVATLGVDSAEESSSSDDDDDGGGGRGGGTMSQEFQDALLEFAECMREHGVDMPDPEISADGGVAIAIGEPGAGAGPPSASDMAEMEEAQEACQPIMDEVESELPRPDPEQMQEMQDQALEFAQCMREHGIDMPDPQFSEDGRITQSIGGPDGPGFDPSDDDFEDAQEACMEDGEGGPGIIIGGGPAGGSSVEVDAGEDG